MTWREWASETCIYVSLATNHRTLSGISCVQNWSCQNKLVILEGYLPCSNWVKCGSSSCFIRHSISLCSHFAISPSFSLCLHKDLMFSVSLCPSFTWSISGVDWHLCFGNQWRNEPMRDCDSRKVQFVQSKQWHCKLPHWKIWIYFDPIINDSYYYTKLHEKGL